MVPFIEPKPLPGTLPSLPPSGVEPEEVIIEFEKPELMTNATQRIPFRIKVPSGVSIESVAVDGKRIKITAGSGAYVHDFEPGDHRLRIDISNAAGAGHVNKRLVISNELRAMPPREIPLPSPGIRPSTPAAPPAEPTKKQPQDKEMNEQPAKKAVERNLA